MKHVPLKTLCLLLFLTAGWLLAGGLTQGAYAAAGTTGDGSCGTNYGIAVKVMNCVEQSICNTIIGTDCTGSGNTSPVASINTLQAITKVLNRLLGVGAIMAISMFGLKLMTPSAQYVQQGKPLIDAAKLVFRIAIAMYLVAYAPTLFTALVGSIGQMIGWVVGTSGGSNGMLANITASCSGTTVDQSGTPSGMNPGEFAIWSTYDCVFYRLVGSGGSSNAIYTSFTALLLPSLISAIFYSVSVGILIFSFGVAVLFIITKILIRSLYVVLLAYVSIAFLILLTPLFAPLAMIESEYVSGLFKRWFFQMIGVIFQPVIIVAFMAMAIATIDQFVEGNIASCAVGTATSVCSFQQLTTNYNISTFVDPNGFNVIEWYISGNPQQGAWSTLVSGDPLGALVKLGIAVVGEPTVHNALNALAGAIGLPVLPDLLASTDAQKTLLEQLALTLASLLFVCYIFYKMLDTVAQIASTITSSDAISIATASLPFENTFTQAGANAKKAMLEAGQGKSFIQGNFSAGDTMTIARAGLIGGLYGAAQGFFGGGGDE